jgi:hypothetical protein
MVAVVIQENNTDAQANWLVIFETPVTALPTPPLPGTSNNTNRPDVIGASIDKPLNIEGSPGPKSKIELGT